MNIVDLDQLQAIRSGQNTAEERYNRDRHMYQQGRAGYPEDPSESLSERDRACYMMGYSVTEYDETNQ